MKASGKTRWPQITGTLTNNCTCSFISVVGGLNWKLANSVNENQKLVQLLAKIYNLHS